MSAIDLPVRILAQTQTEQVGFGDNEIQVLIINLRDVLRRSRRGDLRGKIFQERAWHGGEEVDIGGGVEAAGQVFRNGLDIFGIGLDEIKNGDIGDGIASGVDVPGAGR